MAIKFILLGIMVVGSLTLCGCSPQWKQNSNDTPWIASERQAVEQQERRFHWNTGFTEHSRLIGMDNKIYDMTATAQTADHYLTSWLVRNDPTFFSHFKQGWNIIVSLTPTIVIMIPNDPAKSRKGSLLGTNHPVREFGNRIGTGLPYDYGSVTLYNEGARWFSPDLNQGPEPVHFSSNGLAIIKLPEGQLELAVQGEILKVRRR